MELLGPVVNIYQQQIVQDQILDKVGFVKSFFISHDQILDLRHRNSSDHIGIFIASFCDKDILHSLIVVNLKEVVASHYLAVCH